MSHPAFDMGYPILVRTVISVNGKPLPDGKKRDLRAMWAITRKQNKNLIEVSGTTDLMTEPA